MKISKEEIEDIFIEEFLLSSDNNVEKARARTVSRLQEQLQEQLEVVLDKMGTKELDVSSLPYCPFVETLQSHVEDALENNAETFIVSDWDEEWDTTTVQQIFTEYEAPRFFEMSAGLYLVEEMDKSQKELLRVKLLY